MRMFKIILLIMQKRRDTGLGNTGEIRALINNSDLWRAAIRHDSRVGVG